MLFPNPDNPLGLCTVAMAHLIGWFKEYGWVMNHDYDPSGCLPPSPRASLRFGEALAKARTLRQKKVVRKAHAFLKRAYVTENTFDTRARLNRSWMAGANLEPVLHYLVGKKLA